MGKCADVRMNKSLRVIARHEAIPDLQSGSVMRNFHYNQSVINYSIWL